MPMRILYNGLIVLFSIQNDAEFEDLQKTAVITMHAISLSIKISRSKWISRIGYQVFILSLCVLRDAVGRRIAGPKFSWRFVNFVHSAG